MYIVSKLFELGRVQKVFSGRLVSPILIAW
jgi:hypothetical protein